MREMKPRELIRKLVSIACVTGTIGIALKLLAIVLMSHIWGYLHTFPLIPNVFDSMFLTFSVLWLYFKHEK